MSANTAPCIPQHQVPTLGPGSSDEQIIAHIRAKGPEWRVAFDTLMQRHQSWIFQRCLFYIGNYHDAEDAVQEIMLRVYRGVRKFEGRASFRSWLHSVVYNQCKTFVIRRAKLVITDHMEQSIQSLAELQCPQFSELFDDHVQVARTLAEMPQQAREILHLRFFRDCSLEEIAQFLDISLSAAKMRLYRALGEFKMRYSGSDGKVEIV